MGTLKGFPDPPASAMVHADTQARLERFQELGGVVPERGDERDLLLAVLDSGSFLPGLMFAGDAPAAWQRLVADPWLRQPKPAALFWPEASAAVDGAGDFADFKRRLRLYRRSEMLRLGAREIGWGTTEEVAAELSSFADACLELSFRFCDAELRREYGEPLTDEGPASFVVLAMGKLGGEELNFSSDVDVCYFYSSDAGQAGERSLHEYYSELARRMTAAIEEVTDEGTTSASTCGCVPRGVPGRCAIRSRPPSATTRRSGAPGSARRCCARGRARVSAPSASDCWRCSNRSSTRAASIPRWCATSASCARCTGRRRRRPATGRST